MNILLLDVFPELAEHWRRRGHRVESVRLPGGLVNLPALCSRRGFAPDLAIQQESLGRRTFLTGLAQCGCPTVFWAIDSHLNLHWHRWYGLLFDAVATPHPGLFAALPAAGRPGRVARCAMFARPRPWRPHAARRHDLSFCGVLDDLRPLRRNLAELLAPLGLRTVSGISLDAMLELYADTRMVPNESIANEVNFRLMEAAACGCLSLNPDVGEDQEVLYAPGREMLVYHDGLELLEQISWARADAPAAERMGRAALARSLREHLPEHRADVLDSAAASMGRLTGAEAETALWLAVARQARDGLWPLDAGELARQGLDLLRRQAAGQGGARGRLLRAHTLAGAICLLGECAPLVPRALDLCRALLAAAWKERGGGGAGFNTRGAALEIGAASGSGAAPGIGAFPGAGAPGAEGGHGGFAAMRGEASGGAPGGADGAECFVSLAEESVVGAAAFALALREGDVPLARAFAALRGEAAGDAQAMCRFWAGELERAGLLFSTGARFNPARGDLPGCAFEMLLTARCRGDLDAATQRRCEGLLAGAPAWLSFYLGLLADGCLRNPADWRGQAVYGLASLRGLRVREGLEELREAREKALAAGRGRLFEGLLASHDPAGRVSRVLGDVSFLRIKQ